jgi:hypothetical protein
VIYRKSYISLFYALLIACGTTLSAVHIHIDDFHGVETEHIVVQEEITCVICGSVFKFTPDCEPFRGIQEPPEPCLFSASPEQPASPSGVFYEGRAPPFLI